MYFTMLRPRSATVPDGSGRAWRDVSGAGNRLTAFRMPAVITRSVGQRVRRRTVPHCLLPVLEERGLVFEVDDSDPVVVIVRIMRKS